MKKENRVHQGMAPGQRMPERNVVRLNARLDDGALSEDEAFIEDCMGPGDTLWDLILERTCHRHHGRKPRPRYVSRLATATQISATT